MMKLRLEWKYITPKKSLINLESEFITIETILDIIEDIERTGRVKQLQIYDEQGITWSKKEIEKWLSQMETEPHNVLAYFDGGYDNESGRCGLGTSIYYTQNKEKRRIRKNKEITFMDSNNEAEYAAFFFMLELLEELGVHHLPVVFRGDSQVVLKQLEGEWPCYEENLNRWLDRIEEKMKTLSIRPTYEAIPRKQNHEADHLASQAIEGTIIESEIELHS
jgi:ribonuclease HI